jgi:hypothetical protein
MSVNRTAAPVVGFNHNVKYGPRIFHVQTEDSGLPHAHCITHLFLGGNIVASVRVSYADKADSPDLSREVRSLMETQHKAMLRRLVAGEFNEQAERLAAPHYEPGVLASGQTGPKAVNATTSPGVKGTPARPPSRPLPPVPAKPPPPQPVWQAAPPGASPAPARRLPGAPLPPTTRASPPRAAPPPPRVAPTPRPQPKAPPRAPAAQNVFADTERPLETPHEDLPTLFAEELISEKSLDEVILAFLSADLEPK